MAGGSGGGADMASGGACGSRSPSPAERLPPPFPEPYGGDSDAPGAADSDTEGEDIFTGTVSAGRSERPGVRPGPRRLLGGSCGAGPGHACEGGPSLRGSPVPAGSGVAPSRCG